MSTAEDSYAETVGNTPSRYGWSPSDGQIRYHVAGLRRPTTQAREYQWNIADVIRVVEATQRATTPHAARQSGLVGLIAIAVFVVGFCAAFLGQMVVAVLAPVGAIIWMIAGALRVREDARHDG